MFDNILFEKFCLERNIQKSTINGYESALKHYIKFHDMSLNDLISEAKNDEKKLIPLKDRKIKNRLLSYRSYLLKSDFSPNTMRTYFTKVKTFYLHFDIEIPYLPDAKYTQSYETNYWDLPTKAHIKQACDISSLDLKAIILFMSSSGTAKAETLCISVRQYIDGTSDYHNGGSLHSILKTLSHKQKVVPTFYLKRQKTGKFYYTFCSPEASHYIAKYLQTRKNLKPDDNLFDFTPSNLTNKLQKINDDMNWGFKGNYRFFRAHSLRKFHASNISLAAEHIDALQGRGKNTVHETYIKTNPERLKSIYESSMHNVMIYNLNDKLAKKQEFTIVINIFLSGKEYNIL